MANPVAFNSPQGLFVIFEIKTTPGVMIPSGADGFETLSRSPQSQLFYPGDQSRGLHAQKLRGPIDASDFPASLLQYSKEVLAFAASHFRFGQIFRFGLVTGPWVTRC